MPKIKRPAPIPQEAWLSPPKGTSRAFKSGWQARLNGKANKDCSVRMPCHYMYDSKHNMWIEDSAYHKALYRKQDWHRGYLCCSRRLGMARKAHRQAEEIKRLTDEHDWLAELSEELSS